MGWVDESLLLVALKSVVEDGIDEKRARDRNEYGGYTSLPATLSVTSERSGQSPLLNRRTRNVLIECQSSCPLTSFITHSGKITRSLTGRPETPERVSPRGRYHRHVALESPARPVSCRECEPEWVVKVIKLQWKERKMDYLPESVQNALEGPIVCAALVCVYGN
jgi:hypothetical protein